MSSIPQRHCARCDTTKPLTDFYRDPRKKDGHAYTCKACRYVIWKKSKANPNRHPRKFKHPLNPGDAKPCNVCGETKPVDQFRKQNRDWGDGYYNQCHECERAKGREWARGKKEYSRNWKLVNRDRCYALARIWKERNRDKYDAHRKKYYSSPRGRMYSRNSQAIRRSKSKQGDVTAAWLEQFIASQSKCFYCKKPFNSKRSKTVDHVTPLDKGGEHIMTNLVIACQICNSSKGNKIVMLL